LRTTMVPVVSSASSLLRHRSPVMCGIVFALASPVLAQPASQAEELSRAYALLAAGKAAEAQRAAEQILTLAPRHHGAATVAVVAASETSGQAGLDLYERWLGASRHEDAFVLEPVAIAVLRELSASGRGPLEADARALAVRARGGSGTAGAESDLSTDRGRQLAADLTSVTGGSLVLRLRSLGQTGYRAAAPQVMELLAAREPEVRAAAANTLAALGAQEAIGPLQGLLKDPAGEVRASAATALHRLGDGSGDALLFELLASGIPDIQLQAAEAMAEDPPSGWVPYIEPLLASDAPMTQLHAARLLLPVDPEKARPVLERLLAHANPVVVGEMAKALADAGLADLPSIRRLLRHPSQDARLHGATALLRLTGALP